MLEVKGLKKTFTSGFLPRTRIKAVDDVSFHIEKERLWALIGAFCVFTGVSISLEATAGVLATRNGVLTCCGVVVTLFSASLLIVVLFSAGNAD